MGTLRNYGPVWYYPDGIANIISMSNAEKLGFAVSYSSADGVFHVTNPATATNRIFARSDTGLFFSDACCCSCRDRGFSGYHRRR
jgi:hypothetical protein